MEHLQIAKSRGKGAPKKKRTAAGKTAREIFVHDSEDVVLTAPTQRARSSTARRGNERILGFETNIHCTEFWDTVYRRRKCTVWPRGYHDYECGQLRPPMWQVCMYNILFTLNERSDHGSALVENRRLGQVCDLSGLHCAIRAFAQYVQSASTIYTLVALHQEPSVFPGYGACAFANTHVSAEENSSRIHYQCTEWMPMVVKSTYLRREHFKTGLNSCQTPRPTEKANLVTLHQSLYLRDCGTQIHRQTTARENQHLRQESRQPKRQSFCRQYRNQGHRFCWMAARCLCAISHHLACCVSRHLLWMEFLTARHWQTRYLLPGWPGLRCRSIRE